MQETLENAYYPDNVQGFFPGKTHTITEKTGNVHQASLNLELDKYSSKVCL